jgi:hypothetical protein
MLAEMVALECVQQLLVREFFMQGAVVAALLIYPQEKRG